MARMKLLVTVLVVFSILAIVLLPQLHAQASDCKVFSGHCGDTDGNDIVNISDAVVMISYIFGGGPQPDPLWCADVDLSGFVNISDAVALINYVFGGGSAPCAAPAKSTPLDGTSPWLECVDWDYDGVSQLVFHHRNTVFNCCPEEVSAWTSWGANWINIWQEEDFGGGEPCPCLCLYDVDLVRDPIPPGQYTVTVHPLYPPYEGDPIQFILDLSGPASGSYCVYRSEYPWGEQW
jgi:hypothetical protein